MKATNGKKIAELVSYRFVVARKLHYLADLMHFKVQLQYHGPKDANDEARSQGVIAKAESQRSKSQKGLESKSWDLRPARLGFELENK